MLTQLPRHSSHTACRLWGWLLAALVGVSILGHVTPARAIPYEVFISIETEDDLYDLLVTGQIDDQTFQDLVEILRVGVDLNRADRETLYTLPNLTYAEVDQILAYRTEVGRITQPADLVIAGALSERKLAAIAPFIRTIAVVARKAPVSGRVRYRTIWVTSDKRVPPMALEARVSAARNLTVGAVGLLERNRLAPATWDPNRNGLSTRGPQTRPRVVKFFAQWDTPKWGAIVGTYGIGFGQRLVFDRSGRTTPNGFYFDDAIIRQTELTSRCRASSGELSSTPCPRDRPREYVAPDFRITEGLRGAAIGLKRLELPVGWMQAYGFFSYQTKSIYQYEVWNRDRCDDPRVPGEINDECRAPSVYQRRDDPLEPTSSISYSTLPDMYNELTAGGNVSYFRDRRTHVGITGYGANATWLVDGADLDFQEHARNPYGGPWAAVGADASWGRKWADLFAEVAYSFDSMEHDGGGGPAAIVRHTAHWDSHEIEASARYYDPKFANPYARPISAPDEFEGMRARDEAGGRLRYTGLIGGRWMVRGFLDAWTEVTQRVPKLRTFVRTDVQATRWLRPGLWIGYDSRDLRSSGRDRCFDQGTEDQSGDDSGQLSLALETFGDIGCRGERVQLTGRLRFDPHDRVFFAAQYRHDFSDDGAYDDSFREDIAAHILIGANPIDSLRLRARVRWDWEDIRDNGRLLQTVWMYAQASYRIRRWLEPSLRYDVRSWLDSRDTTSYRRPNPEHWLYLQLTSRF